jgi:hypothetical protein
MADSIKDIQQNFARQYREVSTGICATPAGLEDLQGVNCSIPATTGKLRSTYSIRHEEALAQFALKIFAPGATA